jgi:DNA polymerase-3 subunit delta
VIQSLVGENEVARLSELKKLVSAFVEEHTDMGLEKIDGEEASYERMVEAVQSLPFLASRKLVVLRAPSKNKEFTERFEAFLDEVAETNDVLIVESKLDKRLSYYKQLKKMTEFREFTALDAHGVVRFAGDYAREQGGTLSGGDARYLVERAGANQLLVQHEIDKLIAYNPKITRAAIDLLTEASPQSSIFELLDAAFAGNTRHAVQLYKEQRALGEEPQKIIAMLAWQLHILALVKAAGQRPSDVIAREAKLSPFVVQKSANLVRRLTLTRIKELVTELRVLDQRTKTDGTLPDEAVQYYLLRLAAD